MTAPFILSASRRTDIPAFYSEWFMSRIREGRAEFKHPYSQERISIEIKPETVPAIVFWSKNFAPMIDCLDELEDKGFRRYLVHYTITGLGEFFEPGAPGTVEAVETLKKLSDRIGPDRVLWRFDPMVITKRITVEKTLDRFAGLCDELRGQVKKCYTSIMAPYRKISTRVAKYEDEHKDTIAGPGPDEFAGFASSLAEISSEAAITVHACCTSELIGFGVMPSRCVDAGLISKLWPDLNLVPDPAPTRKACGCHRSIDIGAYDTCPHRCIYCYANYRDAIITEHHSSHRPQNFSMTP